MAYKMVLNPPQQNLSVIWNISAHVGCKQSNCFNHRTDVELVQFLLKQHQQRTSPKKLTPSCSNPPIKVTGVFDAVTAFWIYAYQDVPGGKIDGVVSPADGVSYGSAMWLISWLNGSLMLEAPHIYMQLDTNAELSAGLRAELKRARPPFGGR